MYEEKSFTDKVTEKFNQEGTGKFVSKLAGYGLVGVMGVMGAIGSVHSTGPTEVGVKFNKVTGSTEIYAPGRTYFFLPVINDWSKLETKLVNVPMQISGQGEERKDERLYFKTRDGNDIALALNLSYQNDPAQAPKILKESAQSDDEIRDKIVLSYARSVLRDHFGALSTNEFAVAVKRNEAAERAESALRASLLPYGVRLTSVETKDYEFVNEDFRKAVQRKKNADSELPKIVSEIETTKQLNVKLLNEAESYKNDKIANADGLLAKTKVDADAYFQNKRAAAEGILAQKRNEAAAVVKERLAMASAGGETQVMMKIAESIADKPIRVIPLCSDNGSVQLQQYDVNRFLEMKGLTATAKGQ